MMTRFFARFYAPLLLGFLVIVLAAFSPTIIPKDPKIELEFGLSVGILGLKMPLATWLDNIVLVRVIASFIGLGLITYALLIDFSHYFPQRLKVHVYFDTKGIARTLRQFTSRELKDITPPADWQSQISKYDTEVVAALNSLWALRKIDNAPPLESIGRELLHAIGETQLVVKRSSPLQYKILQGGGNMNMSVEVKNRPTFNFQSAFYLRETRANYLRPRTTKFIRSPTMVLRPEFKQVFKLEHGGADAPFDHILIALTKVSLLPLPTFSDTLYLWRDDRGNVIPIGYAIYSSLGHDPETRSTSF